ncbi:MAG: hypothetical protein Q4E53_06790 [Eubacteriales bacterium]|nr:hypothetical protein [Eubacteriales bacterium]
MTKYVIVGFGCAGYYGAKTIRKNDPDGQITVISEHQYAPYNPMLTTYYVSDKIPFEKPMCTIAGVEDAETVIEWLMNLPDDMELAVGGPRASECADAYKITTMVLQKVLNAFL